MNSSGERGQGARKPQFALGKDEERAGGEGKLTNAAKRLQSEGRRAVVQGEFRRAPARSRTRTEPGREGKWGRERWLARGALQKRPRRGGRREGSWGSGGLAAGRLLPREREEGRGRLKAMMLTGGPGLSAGEREGRREPGGPWPRKGRKRGRGVELG